MSQRLSVERKQQSPCGPDGGQCARVLLREDCPDRCAQVKGLDVIPGLRRDMEASARDIERLTSQRDGFKVATNDICICLATPCDFARCSQLLCSKSVGDCSPTVA